MSITKEELIKYAKENGYDIVVKSTTISKKNDNYNIRLIDKDWYFENVLDTDHTFNDIFDYRALNVRDEWVLHQNSSGSQILPAYSLRISMYWVSKTQSEHNTYRPYFDFHDEINLNI